MIWTQNVAASVPSVTNTQGCLGRTHHSSKHELLIFLLQEEDHVWQQHSLDVCGETNAAQHQVFGFLSQAAEEDGLKIGFAVHWSATTLKTTDMWSDWQWSSMKLRIVAFMWMLQVPPPAPDPRQTGQSWDTTEDWLPSTTGGPQRSSVHVLRGRGCFVAWERLIQYHAGGFSFGWSVQQCDCSS